MTDMSTSMASSMSMSGGFNMMKRNESTINSKVTGGNFSKSSGNKTEADKKSILMNNNFGRT
jgi:hypothetical protein